MAKSKVYYVRENNEAGRALCSHAAYSVDGAAINHTRRCMQRVSKMQRLSGRPGRAGIFQAYQTLKSYELAPVGEPFYVGVA